MTVSPATLDDLVAAREALITTIVRYMPEEHRIFLLGFKRGSPDWTLLDIPGVDALPAVRWKQLNLDKLSAETRRRLVAQLATVLNMEAS